MLRLDSLIPHILCENSAVLQASATLSPKQVSLIYLPVLNMYIHVFLLFLSTGNKLFSPIIVCTCKHCLADSCREILMNSSNPGGCVASKWGRMWQKNLLCCCCCYLKASLIILLRLILFFLFCRAPKTRLLQTPGVKCMKNVIFMSVRLKDPLSFNSLTSFNTSIPTPLAALWKMSPWSAEVNQNQGGFFTFKMILIHWMLLTFLHLLIIAGVLDVLRLPSE